MKKAFSQFIKTLGNTSVGGNSRVYFHSSTVVFSCGKFSFREYVSQHDLASKLHRKHILGEEDVSFLPVEKNLALELHEKLFGGDPSGDPTDPPEEPELDGPDPDAVIYQLLFFGLLFCVVGYIVIKREQVIRSVKVVLGKEVVDDLQVIHKGEKVKLHHDLKGLLKCVLEDCEAEKKRRKLQKKTIIEPPKEIEEVISPEIEKLEAIKEELELEIEENKKRIEELVKTNDGMTEEFEKIIEERAAEHVEECQDVLETTKCKLEMEYFEKNQKRIDSYKKLCTQVSAMENLYASKARYLRNSRMYMDIAVAVFRIQQVMEKDRAPLEEDLQALSQVIGDDKLLGMVVESVPESVKTNGVLSNKSLMDELLKIKKNVIKRSFVEEKKTWLKKNVSRVMSTFMFTDKSELNSVFDIAITNLQHGRLSVAVELLEEGVKKGEAPDTLKPWLELAKSRLNMLECMKIIKCHLMNLSHAIN